MTAARAGFLLWLALVAALIAASVLWLRPALKIETDITAMLPQTAPDALVRQALDRFAAAAGRRNLFLVEAADFDTARRAGSAFAATLAASPAFESVEFERHVDAQALDAALAPYRHGLLSERHRQLLAAGAADRIAEEALHALYTPAGLVRVRPFGEDPLNLYGDYVAQLTAVPGTLVLRDGVASVEQAGRVGVLVTSTLRDSPFALNAQATAMAAVNAADAAARQVSADVRVVASGVLRHAAANSARAKREIGLFGSLSLAGVIAVFLYCFRSLRPLLLVLVTLGISTLASVVAVQALFGQVHLLAFVFGSSLIGVAVDYAIHFFSDRFRTQSDWDGITALRHVGPAIVVGMGTTALGYLAFLAPPFPGLRQMAVFSVAGIVSAGLCVLLAYPMVAGRGAQAPPRALGRAVEFLARLRLPQRRKLALLATGAAVLIGAGLMRLHFVDDVRALQSSPAALLADEAELRARLGGGVDTRFFLVSGADTETVLRREEALRARLDALIERGALSGYSAMSRAVPSAQRQAENRQRLAEQVYGDSGVLDGLLATLGFEAKVYARLRADFEADAASVLTPQRWLESPAAAAHAPLWLGQTGDGIASAVALSGVVDVAALGTAADSLDGVRLIDRVADISTVLAHYRRMALLGLGAALLAIGTVLALRYGLRAAPRQLLPPVGGCLLTLATLGMLGVPANLFTVLALLLVLGLGVDYGVFLREGSAARPVSIAAISVAALTTLLAFGMLSASATPFIRSLGLAVLLGVASTWLLAIVASAAPNRTQALPESQGVHT